MEVGFMSKKMKIIIGTISAVILLSIIGTVTVLADSPPTEPAPTITITPPAWININARAAQTLGITETQLMDAMQQAKLALFTPAVPATPGTPPKKILPSPIKPMDWYAKVAEILKNSGITAEKIAAAFQQAQKEARDQGIKNDLNNAVKNGKISQEEQIQIQEWWQNRPTAADKLGMPFSPGAVQPGQQMMPFGQGQLPQDKQMMPYGQGQVPPGKPVTPPGFGPVQPDAQGQLKNLENRLNQLENRVKYLEDKLEGQGLQP
jgi:hypothetical protein